MATTDERRAGVDKADARERLPATTHIGAVHLQIADLHRSVDYYTQVLGFDVLERDGTNAVMGVAETGRTIATLHEKRGIAPVPRNGRLGLYHFAMLLPDRSALGRFAAHVFRQHMRVGMADHAVSEALYLSDPDGLGIEVYADRPRETWRHRGNELYMVTEPLDIGGVIAAGEDRDWDGAAAGTLVGHVHLHVGGLAEAERFYHSALGFEKTVWSYPGALFLSAGGYHHHLGTNVWSPGGPPGPDEAQLLEWELMVPTRADAGTAARRLTEAGYSVAEGHAGWRSADPWGTRLHIVPQHD